jgi:hypothetical protein
MKADYETQLRIEFPNGSRILCMPGVEETVRCYSPQLIIIDEAARVPDDLYRAVRPMLAVSQGRLVVLSTPFGQRGWFYEEWNREGPWHKIRVTWQQCPRITAEFIAEEERAMGRSWVAQEYECSFEAMEGLVYPDFGQCIVDMCPPLGKPVGGIDWGWRNPFAAEWGVRTVSGVSLPSYAVPLSVPSFLSVLVHLLLAAVWGRSLFAGRGWLVFLFEVAAPFAGLKVHHDCVTLIARWPNDRSGSRQGDLANADAVGVH